MQLSHSQMRDLTTFLLGAAGFLHELVFVPVERPFLLAASLALMGFPFVLKGDAWVRGKDDKPSPPPAVPTAPETP